MNNTPYQLHDENWLFETMKRSEFPAVLVRYEKAIGQQLDNKNINYYLGIACFFGGKFPEAAFHLNQALHQGVFHDNLFDFFVPCLDWLGYDKECLELIEFAEGHAIKSPYFCHFAGEYFIKHNQWERGFAYLRAGQIDYIPSFKGQIEEFWGQDVTDKRLILACNLGFGDSMMAARYLHDLPNMPHFKGASHISLRTPNNLHRLFQQSFPEYEICKYDDPFGGVERADGTMRLLDNYVQGLWLMHPFCGAGPGFAPGNHHWARVDENEQNIYYQQLKKQAGGKKIIGLVASGRHEGQFSFIHHRRCPPPNAWAQLSNWAKDYYIIGLQPPPLPPSSHEIYHLLGADNWGNQLTDFAQTAAIISLCDWVISIDSAMVHLAGALDKPTIMPNRLDSCWRWLPLGKQNIWYPNLHIINQTSRGEWDEVLQKIAAMTL